MKVTGFALITSIARAPFSLEADSCQPSGLAKTLMLWFQDRKGLATGLAVAGFGAAKAIASPIMQSLLNSLGDGGIYKMFLILAVVYFIMMFVGHLLLAKPEGWHESASNEKGDGQNKDNLVNSISILKSISPCRKAETATCIENSRYARHFHRNLADVLYQYHLWPCLDLSGKNDYQVYRPCRHGQI